MIEDDEEDLAELMAEPPGGYDYGWKRNGLGSWAALDLEGPREHRPFTPKNYHGRAYGYVKMKCRCPECRAWKSSDNRARYEARLRNH